MSKLATNEKVSVAELIEADIYAGHFAPGMWLKQTDLEQRYQCTRLALRHALEGLNLRKVVNHVHNKGYHVPFTDAETLRHIWRARAAFESTLAPEFVANITPDVLARLSYLASRYSEAVKTGTLIDKDRANQEFHKELLALGRNPVMTEIIMDLRMRVPLSVQQANHTPLKWEQSSQDHFEMIEALRTKDAARLHDIIIRHVSSSR